MTNNSGFDEKYRSILQKFSTYAQEDFYVWKKNRRFCVKRFLFVNFSPLIINKIIKNIERPGLFYFWIKYLVKVFGVKL